MILDQTLKLEIVLAGAVSANQLEVHVDYIDYPQDRQPTFPQPFRTVTNSTTDVTILASPAGIIQMREPVYISIYNKDSASATPIIKTDNGTTERIIIRKLIGTLETLHYSGKTGSWYVTNA